MAYAILLLLANMNKASSKSSRGLLSFDPKAQQQFHTAIRLKRPFLTLATQLFFIRLFEHPDLTEELRPVGISIPVFYKQRIRTRAYTSDQTKRPRR